MKLTLSAFESLKAQPASKVYGKIVTYGLVSAIVLSLATLVFGRWIFPETVASKALSSSSVAADMVSMGIRKLHYNAASRKIFSDHLGLHEYTVCSYEVTTIKGDSFDYETTCRSQGDSDWTAVLHGRSIDYFGASPDKTRLSKDEYQKEVVASVDGALIEVSPGVNALRVKSELLRSWNR